MNAIKIFYSKESFQFRWFKRASTLMMMKAPPCKHCEWVSLSTFQPLFTGRLVTSRSVHVTFRERLHNMSHVRWTRVQCFVTSIIGFDMGEGAPKFWETWRNLWNVPKEVDLKYNKISFVFVLTRFWQFCNHLKRPKQRHSSSCHGNISA